MIRFGVGKMSLPSAGMSIARQGDDVIGLAELPAVGERRHPGLVGRIAARRAGVHPLHDRVDLRVAQPRVVRERAVRGIGKPRRHLPQRDFLLDRSGPRPHLVIGAKRHRRDFAGPVTRNAVGVENRRDVSCECRRRDSARRLCCAPRRLRLNTENNRRHEQADEEQVTHRASTSQLADEVTRAILSAVGYTEYLPAVVRTLRAGVAELADALASGASPGNRVEVRVLSSAPTHTPTTNKTSESSLSRKGKAAAAQRALGLDHGQERLRRVRQRALAAMNQP